MTAMKFVPLLLALFIAPALGWASVAIPAGVLGSPEYQGTKRKLLEQGSTGGDEAPSFEVIVTCDQQGPTTTSALPLWTVDFGRRLEQFNPLSLFRVSGVYRVDVVYQQSEGLLYVLGFVANRDVPTELSLTIPADVASDDAGVLNAAASSSLSYQPPTSGLGWLGQAGSAAFGGTMVLSFATGLMGASGGVGMGALGFANFAQTFYYTGTLPITNMPENYRAVSNAFGWTSLATMPAVGIAASVPAPGTSSAAEDSLYSKQRFPYPPVMVVPVNSSEGGSPPANSSSSGDKLPGQAVLVPISEVNGEPGKPGSDVFQRPLPGDGPNRQLGGAAPAPSIDGVEGGAGAPGMADEGVSDDGKVQHSLSDDEDEEDESSNGDGAQPNPFDPTQIDDPAYQNPPPEPDLPPSQQDDDENGQERPPTESPQPTPTPSPITGQSPGPIDSSPSPDTGGGDPASPSPAPASPAPTTAFPPNNNGGGIPSPSPPNSDGSGGPVGPSPSPPAEGGDGEPGAPSPSPPADAGGGEPSTQPSSPPPPGIVGPRAPPGSIGGQDGGSGGNYTEPAGPPQPPSPPQSDAPTFFRKRPPPPVNYVPPGSISGQDGGSEGDYVEGPQGPRPPSPPNNDAPIFFRRRPPPPALRPPPLPSPEAEPYVPAPAPAPDSGWEFEAPGPAPDARDGPAPAEAPSPDDGSNAGAVPAPAPAPGELISAAPGPAPAPSGGEAAAPAPAAADGGTPAAAPSAAVDVGGLPPSQEPALAPAQGGTEVPPPSQAPAPSSALEGENSSPPYHMPAPVPAQGGSAAPPSLAAAPTPTSEGEVVMPPSKSQSPAPAPAPALEGSECLGQPGGCPPPPTSSLPPTSAPASPVPPSTSPPPPSPAESPPPPSPAPAPPASDPPLQPPPQAPVASPSPLAASPPPMQSEPPISAELGASPSPPSPLPPSPPPPNPKLSPSPPPSPRPPPPSPPPSSPDPSSPPPPSPSPSPPPPRPEPRSPPPPRPEPSSPPPPRPEPPSPPPPSPKPSPPPPSPKPRPPPPSPPPPSPKPPPPSPKPSPPPPSPRPPPPSPQPKEEAAKLGGDSAGEVEEGSGGSSDEADQQEEGVGRRRLTAAHARSLIEGPLSSLTSSGFYVVTTVTVSDAANGTTQVQNVSDVDVGSSALSRIRAIQSAAAGEDAAKQHLKILWNVLFWSAVVIGGFALLHIAFLLVLYRFKKPAPKMLHLPRLELLLFMMVLPMVVAAGATLLRGPGAAYVAVGVIFAVLLPLAFLGTSLLFVLRYLARQSVEQRRAVYVLQLPPSGGAAEAEAGAAPHASISATVGAPHQQQRGAPATLDSLRRDSSSSLTQQFLASGDGSRELYGPGGAAQFIVEGTSLSTATNAASRPPSMDPGHTDSTAQAGGRSIGSVSSGSSGGGVRGWLRHAWLAFQDCLMRPLLGFDLRGGQGMQQSSASIPVGTEGEGSSLVGQGQWICKSKHDTAFVKRYGSLFEDARGPQVYHITSVYEVAAQDGAEPHAGIGVLVPASYAWSDTVMQTLQTFGILLSVTKMILFALVINSVGSVNSVAQVLALVLVAVMHLAYLRICLPFRMRIELAAEMVASLCDLAVFVCGIILIAKPNWTSGERTNMGIAMLIIQATGFLIFISVRLLLAGRTLLLTAAPLVGGVFRRRQRR